MVSWYVKVAFSPLYIRKGERQEEKDFNITDSFCRVRNLTIKLYHVNQMGFQVSQRKLPCRKYNVYLSTWLPEQALIGELGATSYVTSLHSIIDVVPVNTESLLLGCIRNWST